MPESDRLLIGYQQAVADVRARVMNYANAIWVGFPRSVMLRQRG
ncbi:hypothetical protein [Gordonia westfalica]|uniref:Uncharacterized protein n=1 Tax=Gordonia westfalica TaxID=158898 RepID=A0A1H2E5H1_9ACTN|nr:hypothetical protein [Gordonia westfalica]SDT90275.1 hypothetical protein SAMN04488548_12811 [Gordonia westfalica]SDU77327.1 hypothetical protein SAMN04488548_13527 [Gordonia westfalica]